ncbi:Pyridoxal phosphate phosphatase, partial [Hondaea fermentalgiana]
TQRFESVDDFNQDDCAIARNASWLSESAGALSCADPDFPLATRFGCCPQNAFVPDDADASEEDDSFILGDETIVPACSRSGPRHAGWHYCLDAYEEVQLADGSSASERTTCNLSFADMDFTRSLLSEKLGYIIDCDGVLYHGSHLLPGAREFVSFLQTSGKRHLFLTNASDKSAKRLVEKFAALGLETREENFYTSAMSTATFLRRQKQGGRAFVLGEECLRNELQKEGIIVVDRVSAEMSTPDFLVIGESASSELYNFDLIELAVKLVRRGARLIGTNEDVADRIGSEMLPGTGALILPIAAASGVQPYFVGKPNPLMVRSALDRLDIPRELAVVVGDRMNTDVRAGVEAGVDTVLVLSGVTTPEEVLHYSYRPSVILSGVGDIASIISEEKLQNATVMATPRRRSSSPPAKSEGDQEPDLNSTSSDKA